MSFPNCRVSESSFLSFFYHHAIHEQQTVNKHIEAVHLTTPIHTATTTYVSASPSLSVHSLYSERRHAAAPAVRPFASQSSNFVLLLMSAFVSLFLGLFYIFKAPSSFQTAPLPTHALYRARLCRGQVSINDTHRLQDNGGRVLPRITSI